MGNASKGYRRQAKTYRLVFADEDMAGLVVRARSVNLGAFLGVASLAQLDPKNIGPDDMEKLDGLFSTFADALLEWNLEDEDGRPVPATREGLRSQDVDFVLPIIKAWFDAIAGVAGPLGRSSSAGGPSLEQSIPMEARSQSQAS